MTHSAILMFLLLASTTVVQMKLECGDTGIVAGRPRNMVSSVTCDPSSTIKTFKLAYLCGKTYSLFYTSGSDGDLTCKVSRLVCDSSKLVAKVEEYTVTNGQTIGPQYSQLTDKRNGVLERALIDANGVMGYGYPEYVTSYAEYSDRTFKMSYASCDTEFGELRQVAIISNFDASFTDEIQLLENLYPTVFLTKVANSCDWRSFFPFVSELRKESPRRPVPTPC